MTNAQHDTDKTREEFESMHRAWDLSRAGDGYVNPSVNQRWQSWQASAAKSAATIARLEEEIAEMSRNEEKRYWEGHAAGRNENINERLHGEKIAAAAEADNARLRNAIARIDALRNDIIDRQAIGWSAHVYPLVAILDEALAHPLSASALNAHVAKVTAELQAKVDALQAMVDAHKVMLESALDKQGGALTIADRLESDPEYLHKVAGAPVDIITASCAPDNQKG